MSLVHLANQVSQIGIKITLILNGPHPKTMAVHLLQDTLYRRKKKEVLIGQTLLTCLQAKQQLEYPILLKDKNMNLELLLQMQQDKVNHQNHLILLLPRLDSVRIKVNNINIRKLISYINFSGT